MPKFDLRKLYKFIFAFVMFFSCLNVVNGADWNYKTNMTTAMMLNCIDKVDSNGNYDSSCICDESNGCVPLCIYSDSQTGKETAIIGYFYKKDDYNHTWRIAYFDFEGNSGLYYSDDTVIPKKNIYWEGLEKDWLNSDGYQRLNDKFLCPLKLSADFNFGNELCFEDSGDNPCDKLDNFWTTGTTVFNTKLSKTYDFVHDSYHPIMENVISKLEVHDDDAPDYPLLSSMDKSFKYDTFLTEENCKYFKNNIENSKSYSSILATRENIENYINLRIDPEIKFEAETYKVRFPFVYNYSGLSSLLDKDGSGTYRSIGSSDKNFVNVEKLFYSRLVDIMNKGVKACKTTYNIDINFNKEEMYNELEIRYKEVLGNKVYIDLDSEYSCGFLNSIEDIISTGYFIIELLSVVILIAFSILDYVKVILNGDAEQMKKSNGNLFKRIIIVAIIFLLPAILNITLKLFKIEGFNSEQPLCVKIKK